METVKLTKHVIDNIPFPEKGQVFYRDTLLKGFGLRVGKTTKAYYAEKRVKGKTVRITIGTHGQVTPEQARREAQKLLGVMAVGQNPIDEERANNAQNVNLIEAFDAFMTARKSLKERTISDYNKIIKKYFPDWHKKTLIDISKDMVAKRHKTLGENHGAAQANYAMRVLRAIFNFAIGQYEDSSGNPIITNNPVTRLSQTRAWYRVSRRKTIIKSHDLSAFFRGLEQLKETAITTKAEVVRDYIILMLFTGLRREEAARLKWENVDLRAKTFTIIEGDAKNHEMLTLPMSGYVFDMLKKRHEAKINDYVFPGNSENGYIVEPRRQMEKITKVSGVSFTLHDFRRTFITIAESLDISSYAVKQLVNHKMANDVTAGYIIADVERLREPMQRITDYILEKANILL